MRWGVRRGMDIDEFAPRLSFFLTPTTISSKRLRKSSPHGGSGRAGCARCWAQRKSSFLADALSHANGGRFPDSPTAEEQCHSGSASSSGGCIGGHTIVAHRQLDEAWALPSENAALIALRTQQIIANESGVANTVDPLGGLIILSFSKKLRIE